MEAKAYSQTPQSRTKLTLQRGNFYFGLGFALIAGLLVVVVLGVLGITSLGVFTLSTAMAMIGIAISMLAIVSFVTLVTLRRTLGLLSHHETALTEQAARHADLAAKVQAQWHAEQVIRDRNQDENLATISARQDATFVDAQTRTERSRTARAARGPVVPVADPFGDVHPVRDIEGIGDHYGKLLDDLGFTDTRKLWNADATYVAGGLKIQPTVVENWQCMAELMAIKGIGKQYAELFVRADVSSIDELRAETAPALLNRIHRLEKHQGNRIQGNTIGIKIVQSWINAAQAHHGVAIPVVASNGA
jgi:predicted flap endonuclease-1-like 5' DNA nuclease